MIAQIRVTGTPLRYPDGVSTEREPMSERFLATLESIQVGTPQRYEMTRPTDGRDRVWYSSFIRVPSSEPRRLFLTHLEGNVQADTRNHGRPDQAILVYAGAHYPLWRAELHRPEMGPGGFAENLTLAGLDEQTTCIGDTFSVGDALIRVTGPRYPCWKIERRWGIDGLTARVAATGRTGWYCRVLREGVVAPGMSVRLDDRPYPRYRVALVNDIGHYRSRDIETARAVCECPLLNEWWRKLIVHCMEPPPCESPA